MANALSPAYGYTAYCVQAPPPQALCRFWNESTGARFTCRAGELPVMDTRWLWHKITALSGMAPSDAPAVTKHAASAEEEQR